MNHNGWSVESTILLRKWENDCKVRKKAHFKAAQSYDWKNKMLSIPVIIISTILGSLSFIHPSFLNNIFHYKKFIILMCFLCCTKRPYNMVCIS